MNLARISEISNGTCLLSFSRGKDSVASWIILKKYFKNIIPFHFVSVPNLRFVEESLSYYEKIFQTRILRYIDPIFPRSLKALYFQSPNAEQIIDDINFDIYSKSEVLNMIKMKYADMNTWTAYGISQYDSLDRGIYVKQYNGIISHRKSFYPIYNLHKVEIIQLIKDNNIKLAGDYKFSPRTMADLPQFRNMMHLKEYYPDDYKKILFYYPFIESVIVRNEYRQGI